MTENVPRMFAPGSNLGVQILKNSWGVPEVFKYVQKLGCISDVEMRRVFNMGIGMVLVVGGDDVSHVMKAFPNTEVIGMVVEGEGVQYV
jgi:phosphoribosylformylglycinamidine cyclo-ligase